MDALEKIKSVEWSQQKEGYIQKEVKTRGRSPTAGNNTAYAWGVENNHKSNQNIRFIDESNRSQCGSYV
jgi:hypothetical protein